MQVFEAEEPGLLPPGHRPSPGDEEAEKRQ